MAEINKELELLKEEWESYKRGATDEILEVKQDIQDKRVEYNYKNEKIKELKKEFKATVGEIEHKKQVMTFMQQELDALPKDVNRNQYLKRINEIIKKVKSQNSSIKEIIDEVKGLQAATISVTGEIKQIDVEVEERVFKDTAKDKVAKEIYMEIQALKSNFDKLITGV